MLSLHADLRLAVLHVQGIAKSLHSIACSHPTERRNGCGNPRRTMQSCHIGAHKPSHSQGVSVHRDLQETHRQGVHLILIRIRYWSALPGIHPEQADYLSKTSSLLLSHLCHLISQILLLPH